jgi:glucose-6-phosphate 1-dehydrogenase
MSLDLVLFGGTGDLAWRKLMPALFQAFRHGTLPEGGRIIGIGARRPGATTQYRALIQARFDKVELAKRPSEGRVRPLCRPAAFCAHGPVQTRTMPRWRDLRARNADTVVMYVATAPHLFTTVCEQIAAAG